MSVLAVIAPPSLSPEQIRVVAHDAEASGLEELWLWEDSFWEGGIAMSAALLGMTDRLRVGIGVLPVPFRTVALTAMEVAALDRLFPGRFLLGLGHGVQSWMQQAGVRAASPLGLMREYVQALRPLLAGDEVTTDGAYVRLDRVRLVWPAGQPGGIHLGATGPKSLELSGEVGDGTILVADTRLEELPGIRERIAAGRRRAGRDVDDHEITMFLSARSGDVDATVAEVRAWVDGGAHRVCLQPDEGADMAEFVRHAAAVRARRG